LYLNEEDTFWILATICEDLMPTHYRPQMMGSLVDQKIFEYLLEYFLPDITSYCKSKDVPISIFSGQWFLSLSLAHAPLEVSYRILDCWFCIGRDSLYRAALALIYLFKDEILNCSVEKIQSVFRTNGYNATKLFRIAWNQFEKLPLEKINDIRNEHQFSLIKDLRSETKSRTIATLTEDTRFSIEEVSVLYDIFYDSLSITSDHLMTFTVFHNHIFNHILPFWKEVPFPELSLKVFSIIDNDKDNLLNIAEFISGLNIIYRGNLSELWKFCCKITSEQENTEDPLSNQNTFSDVLILYLRMFEPKTGSDTSENNINKKLPAYLLDNSNFSDNLPENQLFDILEHYALQQDSSREIPYDIMPEDLNLKIFYTPRQNHTPQQNHTPRQHLKFALEN